MNALVLHPHFPVALTAHDDGTVRTHGLDGGGGQLAQFAAAPAGTGVAALALAPTALQVGGAWRGTRTR